MKITIIKISVILATVVAVFWGFGCKKHDSSGPITGCMDTAALNYDPTATVKGNCNYTTSHLAGTYIANDTFVRFNHNATTGWYDTSVSQVTFHVTLLAKDTIKFDTIILCGGTASGCGGNGGIPLQGSVGFYFNNYDPTVAFIGTGSFLGDSLVYKVGTSPLGVAGGYQHKGCGHKLLLL